MSDDKEIVGKDRDSATLASTTREQELIPRAMSEEGDRKIDIQTVDKDRDSENETPAANPVNEPEEACSQPQILYSPTTPVPEDDMDPAHRIYRLICGKVASHAKEIVGKDKDSAYKSSAATPINGPDVARREDDLIYRIKSATMALDYYNNKNDTKFELVEDETLASYPYKDYCGTFIHCVFNAKEDSSIRKFFAILENLWYTGPAVTTCKIVEGETKVDCELCRLAVSHEFLRHRIPDPPTFCPSRNYCNSTVRIKHNCNIAFERIANRSLDHYNKINGTNFVVEEAETICCCTFSGVWIHCCFNAVDSSIKQFNHDDSATKVFFAEIKYDPYSDPVVTNCKIVEGETQVGCENCKSVIHPIDGYRGSVLATSEIVGKRKKRPICPYHWVYNEEFVAASAGLALVS